MFMQVRFPRAAQIAGPLCERLGLLARLDESLAIVSHAGVIDANLRWAVGLGPDTLWQHELEIDNCSIAELHVWNGGRISEV